MRGSDQEAVLELSLEEAARGGKRRISLGDGRDYRGRHPARRPRRPADPARRARAAPASAAARRAISSCASASGLTLAFASTGGDLYVDLPVAPWEAALGATVEVPTLDGNAG